MSLLTKCQLGTERVCEGEEEEFVPERAPVDIDVRARTIAVGMASLDMVDMREVFQRRAVVMRTVPVFLKGAFKAAFGVTLEERLLGEANGGFHQGPAGLEVVHASAQNDLVSTTSRRQSPPEAVGRTVPSIRPWRLDVSGEIEHAGR